jgi:hypothetical protein
MSWESWERAAEHGPYSIAWKVGCFAFVLIAVVSVVGGVAAFVANPFRQAGRVVEKTIDADNVIYNYEWFKRQWRDVGAIDTKIAAQQKAVSSFEDSAGPRTDWTRDDKIEHARLSSIVTGLEQQRADIVALYNARAAMVNRQIFMGRDCPEHIQ